MVRFRLRLARFDYIVCHVPGKLLYTADALSRTPLNDVVDAVRLGKEADFFADQVVTSLPASAKRLREYKEGQDADTECAKAKAYCLTDWPSRSELEPNLIPYWEERNSLSIHDGLASPPLSTTGDTTCYARRDTKSHPRWTSTP